MATPVDRPTYQTLVTKLDTNAMSLSDAKAYVKRVFALEVPARTKRAFIKNLYEYVERPTEKRAG